LIIAEMEAPLKIRVSGPSLKTLRVFLNRSEPRKQRAMREARESGNRTEICPFYPFLYVEKSKGKVNHIKP
jgi:hypothetical protein